MKQSTKRILLKNFGSVIRLRSAIMEWYRCNVSVRDPKQYGRCGEWVMIGTPLYTTNPKNISIDSYCRVQSGAKFIVDSGKLSIGRFSALGNNCTIVTGNHISTVTVPHILLGALHINDKERDVAIEEDVWVGANATILSGVTVGRGAIVAAGSLVNRSVPPYALVAGVPAKIVAVKFSVEQIIEHEKSLYEESERLDIDYLKRLFERYYKGKRLYGTSKITALDIERLNAMKQKWGIKVQQAR